MDRFMPEVGEDCLIRLHRSEPLKGRILFKGDNIIVYNLYDIDNELMLLPLEFSATLTQLTFKPLLSEEEQLVGEMTDCITAELFEGNEENICLDLINAGYRKVNPISYADFRENISEHDEDWVYMCDNGHIIIEEHDDEKL